MMCDIWRSILIRVDAKKDHCSTTLVNPRSNLPITKSLQVKIPKFSIIFKEAITQQKNLCLICNKLTNFIYDINGVSKKVYAPIDIFTIEKCEANSVKVFELKNDLTFHFMDGDEIVFHITDFNYVLQKQLKPEVLLFYKSS